VHNGLVDQLLALDTLFLGMESESVQSNIGGVSVLEGPPPPLAELRRYAQSMLEHSPRYRQCILELPPGLGRPLWVDDEQFDINNHLIEADLGDEVTLGAVADFFAGVMSERLDRARPLWKIHVVRGLPHDEWAILWTVHHAMVDGIAATELMSLLLSFDPAAEIAEPAPWQPQPRPDTLDAARNSLTGPTGPLRPLRDLSRAVRSPGKLARAAASTARGLLPAGRSALQANDCPLNGPIGPGRIWHVTELDLQKVKLAGTLFGGTVNDVVLTAVAGGLREFLLAADADLAACRPRTMVPVSLRTEQERGSGANRVSAVFVDLPVALADPADRLADVRAQMNAIKESRGETAGEVLGEVANYLPHAVFEAGERTLIRLADVGRFFNTVTTNVPGPQLPLYCLGREMRAVYPYIMLMKDLRVSTAVLSYNGGVYFGVTGDRASAPDIARVCAGINSSLDQLLASRGLGRVA
jgi:WS/DGAT/MGAT family acyltransferase